MSEYGAGSHESTYERDTDVEYINVNLPSGESVRYKRVWSGHRFTDREVAMLSAGMEVKITTEYTHGIIGSLDWQEYLGYDYYGFAPWDAEAYSIENAPFPRRWNNHEFTPEEQAVLRSGERLLVVCTSNRTGSVYAVNVSFALITGDDTHSRWGIVPHFEEFEMSASEFTRETCPFLPIFGGKQLSLDAIRHVRCGEMVSFKGVSRNGKPYKCRLFLALDEAYDRWRLTPKFD